MEKLESVRAKLYEAISRGNHREILKISQELDRIILTYYLESQSEKSA